MLRWLGRKPSHIANWVTYIFIQVLQSDSRWAILSVTLGIVSSLPNVDAKTPGPVLPDNGLRFLPEDLEKVIPSSLPLANSSLDGNSRNLKSCFIALATVLPIMGILFAFFSWRRWRKDQELYERMIITHQSKQQMLYLSEKLINQLEKNTDVTEWTSIQVSPEKAKQLVEIDENIGKEPELSEKQDSETLDQNLNSDESTQPSLFPYVVIPIDPPRQMVLNPNSNTKEVLSTSKIPKSSTLMIAIGSKKIVQTSSHKLDKVLGEHQNNNGFSSMCSSKIKRDSIQLHFEKRRKALIRSC